MRGFQVYGQFYTSGGYKLRSYLDVCRVGAEQRRPDLMVIMMNPGSSYPLDGIDDSTEPSLTQADTTQRQVMKLMGRSLYQRARILNLSDLRTPDSNALYAFLRSRQSRRITHSIFSPARRKELEQLFVRHVPVVFAWGVNPALLPLARQAVEVLSVDQPLGLLKPGTQYAYYHPLPRDYPRQLEWLRRVKRQLAEQRKSFKMAERSVS